MKKYTPEWYVERKELTKQAFPTNKHSVIAALSAAGIAIVQVDYSGNGDSGNGMDFRAANADGTQVSLPSTMVAKVSATRNDQPSLGSEMIGLETAIADLADEAINQSGHSGYEIDAGGGGTMTIDVAAGTIVLEHYDIIEDREEYRHEL